MFLGKVAELPKAVLISLVFLPTGGHHHSYFIPFPYPSPLNTAPAATLRVVKLFYCLLLQAVPEGVSKSFENEEVSL